MTGNNLQVEARQAKQRQILTDKKGIPISAYISSSASTDDIKLVTSVVDNVLSDNHHHHIKQKQEKEEEEENFNIYVQIKHIIPN